MPRIEVTAPLMALPPPRCPCLERMGSHQVAAATSNGKTQSPFEAAWAEAATIFGLKKSWLGKSFNYFGNIYKVIGLKPGSRKWGVICECNGNMYRFNPQEVIEGFRKN